MKKKVFELKEKMLKSMSNLAKDESGMELLQLVIGCLIAVVLGGILLKFFDVSFTEIGGLMVNKIKSIFSL